MMHKYMPIRKLLEFSICLKHLGVQVPGYLTHHAPTNINIRGDVGAKLRDPNRGAHHGNLV